MHDVTFTPIVPSVIKGQGPFLGFDGFIGRGRVDPLGADGWDGDVTLHIVFENNTSTDIVFTGDTGHDDIGAIGFDEINEPGLLVASVSMQLDATGAWDEVKQFNFSVPGGVSTVPEPSTWAMLFLGFAGLGYVGFRRSKKDRLAALA